jgi:hypothetical protein
MPENVQGYGTTLTGNGLSVDLIDIGTPADKIGTRETTTLANTAYVTKTINKLKETGNIEGLVGIADGASVKAAFGVKALYTLTIAGIYSYVAWAVISEKKGAEAKARTHDHELTMGFTLEFCHENTSGTYVAPVETWL